MPQAVSGFGIFMKLQEIIQSIGKLSIMCVTR